MSLVSVVIPTRNRAHLLQYSLQSALGQDLDGLEVVVSDNDSTDGTPDVVAGLRDSRCRHVRTPRFLGMTESWEFALSNATGEMLTVLCDDAALCPDFARVAREAMIESGTRCATVAVGSYYHSTMYMERLRNRLRLPDATGEVRVMESRQSMGILFRLGYVPEAPVVVNCLFHREVYDAVVARLGRFVVSFSPDYAAGMALMAFVDRYVHIDGVHRLSGQGREARPFLDAFGVRTGERDSLREMMGDGAGEVFRHVPLQTLVSANGVADNILAVQAAAPERFEGLALDLEEYFVLIYTQLLSYGGAGGDLRGPMEEYERVLAAQEESLRRRVLGRNAANRARVCPGPAVRFLKGVARGLVAWCPPLEAGIRRAWGQDPGWRTIDGGKAGFGDIWEAARWVRANAGVAPRRSLA
ncbi:MAG: glycosyltransferase [Planctomycetes bacterium]|nr:glycosyltransferase [Planctomycetota bacterium]